MKAIRSDDSEKDEMLLDVTSYSEACDSILSGRFDRESSWHLKLMKENISLNASGDQTGIHFHTQLS